MTDTPTMIPLDPGPFAVPMPLVLVGARVEGKPDWKKIDPLLFTFPDKGYWRLGDFVARAWSVGKQHEPG